MLPGISGISGLVGSGILNSTVTWTDAVEAESGATAVTDQTFSAVSLGSEDSNRFIIVGVGARGAGNGAVDITSVSVAGVSASLIHESAVGAQSLKSALWAVGLPTGTTGDVVVNFSPGATRRGISVYSVIANDPENPTDTLIGDGTIDVLSGGSVIAFANGSGTSGDVDFTWSGLTEDADINSSSFGNYSSASSEFSAPESAYSVSVTGEDTMIAVAIR